MAFIYGTISFGPHGPRNRSEGVVDGRTVVIIHKHKNHTRRNHGIYSVVVEGVELPERFRGIDEARRAGQVAFEATKA